MACTYACHLARSLGSLTPDERCVDCLRARVDAFDQRHRSLVSLPATEFVSGEIGPDHLRSQFNTNLQATTPPEELVA